MQLFPNMNKNLFKQFEAM